MKPFYYPWMPPPPPLFLVSGFHRFVQNKRNEACTKWLTFLFIPKVYKPALEVNVTENKVLFTERMWYASNTQIIQDRARVWSWNIAIETKKSEPFELGARHHFSTEFLLYFFWIRIHPWSAILIEICFIFTRSSGWCLNKCPGRYLPRSPFTRRVIARKPNVFWPKLPISSITKK